MGTDNVFQLPIDKRIQVFVQEVDRAGNPETTPPTGLTITSSDTTILTVNTATDGKTFIEPTGKLGSAQISVSADGLTGVGSIETIVGTANHIAVTFGELEDLPATP